MTQARSRGVRYWQMTGGGSNVFGSFYRWIAPKSRTLREERPPLDNRQRSGMRFPPRLKWL